MSKYGVPRVNVTFKDINKIEEGYRIYKDTTSFDETTLPTPLVDISAEDVANFKLYNHFDGDVLEGNTYFYRVGTYGGGEEILSDEKQVVADVSPQGYIYLSETALKKTDLSGNEIWSINDDPYTYQASDSDPDGNVYVVYSSNSYNVFKIKKLDSDGNLLWEFDNGTPDRQIYCIFVDNKKNTYFGSRDTTVKKLDPSGNVDWTFNGHTNNVTSVVVDNDGYVYSTSYDNTVRKIDPNGNEVWSYTGHSDLIECVDVDANGYVYSGSRDRSIRKIDPNGNEVWKFELLKSSKRLEYYTLYVDYSGFIYAANDSGYLVKLDIDGNELWETKPHNYRIRDISMDADGNIYTASSTTKKLSPDGSELLIVSSEHSHSSSVAFGNIFNKNGLPF